MRPTHTAREATRGNNAPETKPIPVESGGRRHDGIVYTQRRRRRRTRGDGQILTFWRILQKVNRSTPARRSPRSPEYLTTPSPGCMSRAAAPFPLGAETSRTDRLEGGPGFFRDGRHVSGYGSESGRAVRAVRGRCGRLRAALWRLRDALPGSTGNGFVSGALLPLVASRAVCVGRIYSGLWRNYG